MRRSIIDSRGDHDGGTVIMADKKKRRGTSCQYGRSRTTDEEADPAKCDIHQVTIRLRNSANVSGGGSIVSHLDRISGCEGSGRAWPSTRTETSFRSRWRWMKCQSDRPPSSRGVDVAESVGVGSAIAPVIAMDLPAMRIPAGP